METKPPDHPHLNESFFAGKDAARREATDANRRENRFDARALAVAIAAVCARGEPPLTPRPGKKFAESIRADIRGVLEASQDPKIQKKLLGEWPHWVTISRLIEDHSLGLAPKL